MGCFMDVRAEVIKIINKVLGKTSFLDVCFFDHNVIASLRQIDFLRKKYDFRGSPLEFSEVKSVEALYGIIKRYSPGFNDDQKQFTRDIFAKFANDIFRGVTFKKADAARIISHYKTSSGHGLEYNVNNFENDNISYGKIFSEILKTIKNSGLKINIIESEIMAALNISIYSLLGDKIIDKGLNILNLSKQGKDVIHFLTILEKVFKIKIPFDEVGNGDIFTNVYKWINFQRPDFNLNKAAVEQEIIAIAAKVFNDSNLILSLINDIEAKYTINISKEELFLSNGLEGFVKVVEKCVKDQRPQLATANLDLSLEVLTLASTFLSKHFDLPKPKNLTSEVENKFISDVEKRFKVKFSVFDLLEITGLESIIKSVERLVKKQKVNEKYPGLLPATADMGRHVRSEVLKISRENMIINPDMSSMDIGGLDFPKKIDSMLAIEVVVQLEKTFKIKIPEEKLYSLETLDGTKRIDHIVTLIEGLLSEKGRRESEIKPTGDLKDKL